MKEEHDDKTAYCRALGHYVPFKYCRTVSGGIPCRRIKDCWFEKIDIEHYIMENFTESERERIFTPPPEKIASLVDLIQKARGKAE
jgi:hypothetical protein